MYGSNFSPDGLTEQDIDRLLVDVFTTTERDTPAPTSALLDGSAARRRQRRIERRNGNGVVRLLRVLPIVSTTDDGEAA